MGQALTWFKHGSSDSSNNNNISVFSRLIYNMGSSFDGPRHLDTLFFDMPPVPREISLQHAWNADDSSPNISIKDDNKMTCYRGHDNRYSTDCIRGKVGYSTGLHLWEIYWPTLTRDSYSVIGVATREAPLQIRGHQNLVGSNDQSWGWDLNQQRLYDNDIQNNDICGSSYPSSFIKEFDSDDFYLKIYIPDKFFMVLDMDRGTLGFIVDGDYLDDAFTGLKGKTLFPIVSTIHADCEITMRYMIGMVSDTIPPTLKDLSRRVVRKAIGKRRLLDDDDDGFDCLKELGLPQILNRYLMYYY